MKIATHKINGVNGRLPVLPEELRRRRLMRSIRPKYAGLSKRSDQVCPAPPYGQVRPLSPSDDISKLLGDLFDGEERRIERHLVRERRTVGHYFVLALASG